MEKKPRPTWDELVKLEPRLTQLLDRICATKDNKRRRSFCANLYWYGDCDSDGFKEEMKDLVGYTSNATDPRLRSMEAYAKLYMALPDCRNCACM